MAKKLEPPKYYVYYDKKTGKLLSVGNEKDSQYEYGIEVKFEEIESLLDGTARFKDYLVGYKRDVDGSSRLAVVPNTEQGYTFKNNVFEWITESNKATECIVTWNGKTKHWEFSLSDKAKNIYKDSILIPKLVFFVTLESDFDFLIRTIFLDAIDLISSEHILVPFESNIETKISKISISSKLVFKTYGLKVIYD
jgi:hypothetical protein